MEILRIVTPDEPSALRDAQASFPGGGTAGAGPRTQLQLCPCNDVNSISFHVGLSKVNRGTKRTVAPDSANYAIDSDNTSSSSSQFDVPVNHDEGIYVLLSVFFLKRHTFSLIIFILVFV